MFKPTSVVLIFVCAIMTLITPHAVANGALKIDVTLPKLNVNPYHKPFVAVWLETQDRKYVTTIALWANDKEWYKDLRQWWRKAGRSQQPYDAVTGATKKPGTYTIDWSGKDAYGNLIPAGTYQLSIEASREEGGREYLKTQISIDDNGNLTLLKQSHWRGKSELGDIRLRSTN